MKIKQRELDKLNARLAQWRGADVYLNSYVDTEDRLIIAFERRGKAGEHIGICFLQCVFLSGPTRWQNCNMECQICHLVNGEEGFEARDVGSGFILKCAGPIVVGDNDFIIPSD